MNDITKIKVDGEPESSYQLYPRNEEFAKRAGGNTGSQSGVQPDWNQNDATKPDYIKNRPFYEEPIRSVTVENVTSEALEGFPIFAVGDTVNVNVDGVEHSLVAYDDGVVAIGDTSSDIDNGEGQLGWQILVEDDSAWFYANEAHTVSYSTDAVYHTIDPKYIRDMYYTGDQVETVLVEESTVSFADKDGRYWGQLKSTFSAIVGDTYKVSWDGASYECTCVLIGGLSAIGNPAIMGLGSDTGEPFIMGVNNGKRINIFAADTSAFHTFSISEVVSEVVKIDEKYLPDTIATKSDVDEKLGNCIKTVNGTAPDASGNVEVQTISEDALSTNQYGTVIIVKNGVVFKNRLGKNTQMPIGESNAAFLVKEGKTSNIRDTKFAFAVATDANNSISVDQILLSRNGIDFNSENVAIKSFKPGNISVDVIQLNGSTSHGVMVEIAKDACFVLPSSTAGSTKKFKITVDDSGAITATEVT